MSNPDGNPEIWRRLNEVFRRIFKKPELSVKAESSTWDIPGWDSIAHLQLILATEKEFGVQFEVQEIAGIEKAGDLYACIERKGR